MISYWCIGGSSDDDKVRRIGWDIPAKGWKHVVDTVLAYDLPILRSLGGRPRVLLHNPFGQEEGGAMRMHQAVACRNVDATRHLVDSFVQAWSPVVDAGAELILYYGFNNQVDNSASIVNNRRIYDWFLQALQLKASVAIDCLAAKQDGETDTNIAFGLEQDGLLIYPEGIPTDHWFSSPVIVQTNDPKFPTLRGRQHRGEVIILDPHMSVGEAVAYRRLGYTACVPLHDWRVNKADLSPLGGKAAA